MDTGGSDWPEGWLTDDKGGNSTREIDQRQTSCLHVYVYAVVGGEESVRACAPPVRACAPPPGSLGTIFAVERSTDSQK